MRSREHWRSSRNCPSWKYRFEKLVFRTDLTQMLSTYMKLANGSVYETHSIYGLPRGLAGLIETESGAQQSGCGQSKVGVVTFSLIANRNTASTSDSTPSEKLSVRVPVVMMLQISLRTTRSCLLGVATGGRRRRRWRRRRRREEEEEEEEEEEGGH